MTKLIVVAVLLLVPVAASAECAWVLWTEVSALGRDSPNPWRLERAERDEPACQAALLSELSRFRDVNPEFREHIRTSVTGSTVTFVTKQQTTTWTYRCLPDTIDPRGPKGGTR